MDEGSNAARQRVAMRGGAAQARRVRKRAALIRRRDRSQSPHEWPSARPSGWGTNQDGCGDISAKRGRTISAASSARVARVSRLRHGYFRHGYLKKHDKSSAMVGTSRLRSRNRFLISQLVSAIRRHP
jgi:hypothetical protein